jgi:predicted DNA-binding transcriptional regulator AlpA
VPDYIDTPEVSEMTGVPVATLTWYRATDQGPRSVKIGRRVRYHKADVLEWLAAQEAKSARGGVR